MLIHHGNADVERSLSDNKQVVTPHRVSLGPKVIQGLRRTKELARSAGGAHNVNITKLMLGAAKNAYSEYEKRWCQGHRTGLQGCHLGLFLPEKRSPYPRQQTGEMVADKC